MSSTHSLSSSGSSRNLSGPFQNIISVAPMARPRQHLEFSTLNFDIADIHRIPIPLPSPPSRIEFLHNPLEPSLPSLSTSYAQTVNFWHSDQYRSLFRAVARRSELRVCCRCTTRHNQRSSVHGNFHETTRATMLVILSYASSTVIDETVAAPVERD